MAHKYFKGVVPVVDPDVEREFSLGLAEKASEAVTRYQKAMESFAFHKAIGAIWEFINQMNKYVDVTAPWLLAKNKSGRPQLEVVIYNLLEGLRVVAGLIYPVMPDTAAIMTRHLGLDADKPFFKINLVGNWKMLTPGIQLPKSTTLFPRIELRKEEAAVDTEESEKALSPPLKPEITIDDFGAVDLRVATVIKAEAIPRAKKLLKLEVDLGEPQARTLVAGIAGAYDPESLVGKQVVVVANLKPAKLMGVQSQGMVLAASNGQGTVLLMPEKPMLPGTAVR
jgi:methionyl-tRNA synthetase